MIAYYYRLVSILAGMRKKLYRNFQTGLLGGVASGLSEQFNIPPFFIRLLFIVLFMALGLGLFLYIALWVLLPGKENDRRIIDPILKRFQKWKKD
ncbi:phage shock protein C (PspC) family protein [Anseongella ginsenosidimutans]|uniref:Phage shock protein C (PspC) family protein n=1 Tax=Anseongella ginsenosidimutans TaxID=496056 RepID=A0A4R3KNT0_9SPHI|nr:PspC domain-containing protein [Anseongella ginsenosidimutans]QEC53853.1 PspC domain-containing protein [Anseongella ginsenosidimutans]TCS86230.1 phage shock protein C (PspC) family protein [Anseongella ginsenosidimutans]